MAKIALRAYNREIEKVIERGQIEEAIAHCKYILRFFPKHIETYRLLGKAYIESQRYSEAADILQRILSVLPDDFVAQIGMSIIREDEGNLDAAIFHMEHAHEIQPSNNAVQDELRRLYGRRDGVEPPRLRLTRGALVRLYAKGDLFRQAIAEIRAALAEDPNRFDLEVILARMYFMLGQKVEATEIASRLVAKLPFCMEANKILADVLPDTSRADDAKIYQQRIYALDPYLAYISANAPTSSLVPDNAVTLDRLDWQPSRPGEEQPAWAQNAGIALQSGEETEISPDWLSTPENTQPDYPDLEAQGMPSQEAVDHQPIVTSEIPDWMQSAGWGSGSAGIQEQETPLEDDFVAPAELPDWLKGMAPKEPTSSTGEEDPNKLEWLDQILAPAETTQLSPLEDNDLEGLFPGATEAQTEEKSTPFAQPSGSEENSLPDWLIVTSPEFGGELLPPTQESAPDQTILESTDSVAAESLSETLTPDVPEQISPPEIPADVTLPEVSSETEDLPALRSIETSILSEDVLQTETAPAATFEQPEAIQKVEPPEAEVTPPVQPSAPPSQAGSQPDWSDMDAAMAWLEGLAAKQGADQATLSTNPEERLETPPDWVLSETDEALPENQTTAPASLAAEAPITDSPLAESLEVIQDAGKPVVDFPGEVEMPAPETQAKDELPEVTPPAAELSTVEDEPTGDKPEVMPLTTDQLTAPASDRLTSSERKTAPLNQPSEPPAAVEPVEMDADAAFAWLESLAAQQGATEGTLSTPPEERPAAPPDWVLEETSNNLETASSNEPAVAQTLSEDTAPIEPPVFQPVSEDTAPIQTAAAPSLSEDTAPIESAAAQSLSEDTAPTVSSVRSLQTGEWTTEPELSEDGEAPEAPAAAGEDKPEEEPLPSWLQNMDLPPATTSQLSTPPEMDDLPDWLKGFESPAETPLAQASDESISVSSWLKEQDVISQADTQPIPESPVSTPPEPESLQPPARPEEFSPREPAFPADENSLIGQGQSALKQGNFDHAVGLYSQLIDRGENLAQVIHDLHLASTENPEEISVWQALGDAYMRDSKVQEALDAYSKAEDLLK